MFLKAILKEGVESLDEEELKYALRARGMRVSNSIEAMQKNLSDWLDLSLKHNLPSSLLILSRSFVLTPDESNEKALESTISSLPEEILDNVELELAERSGKASPEQKLEVLKAQNEMIEEELEEEKEKAKQQLPISEKPEPAQILGPGEVSKPEEIKPETLHEVSEAISALSTNPLTRSELEALKISLKRAEEKKLAETAQAQEAISQAPAAEKLVEEKVRVPAQTPSPEEIQEKERQKLKDLKRAKAMDEYLEKVLKDLEKEIVKVEKMIGMGVHHLDRDGDGVISVEELVNGLKLLRNKEIAAKAKEIASTLDKDQDGKISIQELIRLATKDFNEGMKQEQKQ